MTKAIVKEGNSVLMSSETTVYCIDASGSMDDALAGWGGMSKKAAVQQALRAMVQARMDNPTSDRVGFIIFGSSHDGVKVLVPPKVCGPEHFAAVQTGIYGGGDTPMYGSLEQAARELADAENLTRIVLMSDGEPNVGGHKSECLELIQKLSEEYGFVVDTVGIGVPGKTGCYDEHFMRKAAELGAGEFYPVDEVDKLVKLLVQTATERMRLLGGGIKLLSGKVESA